MVVRIVPNGTGAPADKLADAELVFQDGILAGLKLVGFSIWFNRRRDIPTVTFPARQYAINGERRSFALLRPAEAGGGASHEALRLLILRAYAEYEHQDTLTFTGETLQAALVEAPPHYEAPALAEARGLTEVNGLAEPVMPIEAELPASADDR